MNRYVFFVIILTGIYLNMRRQPHLYKDFHYIVFPKKLQALFLLRYGDEKLPFNMVVWFIFLGTSILVLWPLLILEQIIAYDFQLFYEAHFLFFGLAMALWFAYGGMCEALLYQKKKAKKIVGRLLKKYGFRYELENSRTTSWQCFYHRTTGGILKIIRIANRRETRTLSCELRRYGPEDAAESVRIDKLWSLSNAISIREVLFSGMLFYSLAGYKAVDLDPITDNELIAIKGSKLIKKQTDFFPYHINDDGNWAYETQKEFERALWEINKIIQRYGFDWLDKKPLEAQTTAQSNLDHL